MEEQCINCAHSFDIHHLSNCFCGACEHDEFEEYDLSEETCPDCKSEAIGMSEGVLECFSCGNEWKPKN